MENNLFLYGADPGKYIHTLLLKSVSVSTDPIGGYSTSNNPVISLRGLVRPVSGKELTIAEQQGSTVSHNIEIRYLPGVTLNPTMCFVYDNRTFNIVSVINVDERNHTYKCYCLERNS